MISIIIPLYNKEKTIYKSIESVLSQTDSSWELIIVNDGSTDNSLQIVERYLKDDRIKLVDKLNGGVSSARNEGLSHANGEWILFLDADDYLVQNALEVYNDAICTAKAQVVISNFYMSSNGDNILYSSTKETGFLPNYLIDWIKGDICPRCGATLYDRTIISNNLFDERISRSEDTKFAIESLHGLKIYYTSVPVMFYDQDNLNLSKVISYEKDYISVLSLKDYSFWERVFLSGIIYRGIKNHPGKRRYLIGRNKLYIFYYALNRLIYYSSRVRVKMRKVICWNY